MNDAENAPAPVSAPEPVEGVGTSVETVWQRVEKVDFPNTSALGVVAVLTLASWFANVALRATAISLAMTLSTIGLVVAHVLVAKELKRDRIMMLALALVASSNYYLRSSELVGFLSVVGVGIALGAATYRPFGLRFSQWAAIISDSFADLFSGPGWFYRWLPKPSAAPSPQVLRGISLAAIVTLPVVLLLASGDAVFASLFEFELNLGNQPSHVIITGLLLLLSMGLTFSAARGDKKDSVPVAAKSSFTDLAIAVGGLVFTLGVWCVTQLVVASGGADSIFEDNDLTRAEYARSGFFQLVGVALIVILVLSYTTQKLVKNTVTGDRSSGAKLLKVLGTVLAAETVVLVAVSYYRLDLYMDAFGLTSTRLLVAAFLAWLFVLLCYLILQSWTQSASGHKLGSAYSFAAVTAVIAITLFGWMNPDALIAETNLSRSQESEEFPLDVGYLVSLSPDVTPVLVQNKDLITKINEDQKRLVSLEEEICRDNPTTWGWLGSNRGINKANEAVENC